jgi:hypothetical protein
MRKTNKPEPLLTRRKAANDVKTGISYLFQDKVYRKPDYWVDGIRRKGGVSLIRASVGNCGNQCFDAKGETQEAETSSVRVPM